MTRILEKAKVFKDQDRDREGRIVIFLNKAALIFGAMASVVALTDAIWRATVDTPPSPFDEATITGNLWAGLLAAGSHVGAFLLFTAVLLIHATDIVASRWTLWILRLTAANFLLLAVLYTLLPLAWNWQAPNTAVEVAFGVSFALVFLLSTMLGISMLRRRVFLGPALLLASPLVLVPIIAMLSAWTRWGHPGYAETAIYLGIPWLAIAAARSRPPAGFNRPGRESLTEAPDPAAPQ